MLFGSGNKTKECPSCALEAPEEAEECPYCQYEFPPEQKGRNAMAWLFVILIILWLLTRL